MIESDSMHLSGAPDSMLQLLEIRPLSVDDLSTARYVVGAAFTKGAKGHYSAAEAEAFATFVRSPHYADILLGNRAYAAWVGSEMVGIAAWSPSEEKIPTARILAIFVHPMFAAHGIGTRLGEYLADEAGAAGYRTIEASVTLNAVPFFADRLGYVELRRTAWGFPSGRELAVAIMRKISGGRVDIIH